MQILWFKQRNLRLQDSEPLFLAMKESRRSGPVLPVFIHEPSIIRQPDMARQHQVFTRETLDELADDIGSIGGDLAEYVGEAVEALDSLHRQRAITKIWTHRETSQNVCFDRDRKVRAWARDRGISLVEVEQDGIARGSQPKESFPDYFARAVQAELRDPMGKDLSERFASLPVPSCNLADIPAASGEDKPLRPRGGRRAAMELMNRFFTIPALQVYPKVLSSPNTAWGQCSRMSTYLATGTVSDREIFQRVDGLVTQARNQMNDRDFEAFQGKARFYLDRLAWRRNYIQSFEDRPELEHTPMLAEFKGVREEVNDDLLERWKNGMTGFAFVDAAMRCLRETGWLNMRLRGTVVSFATMNLWQPNWPVAHYLGRELADFHPAVHHVIHQLVAGMTSFDGLMVYDVVKQGFDHDKDGDFVRRYVPELADLPGGSVHDLSMTGGHLSEDARAQGYAPYPFPVVDHKATAKLAKENVHAIRYGMPLKTLEPEPQQSLF